MANPTSNGTKSLLKICCKAGPVLFNKIDTALSTQFYYFFSFVAQIAQNEILQALVWQGDKNHQSTATIENLQRGLFKKQTPCTFRGKVWMNNGSLKNALNWGIAFLRTSKKSEFLPQKSLCIETILLLGAQDTIRTVTSRSPGYTDIHPG